MNRLEHLPEFQTLLHNYRVSTRADAVLQQVELVLLVAPSSMGRNTIIRELLKTDRYHFVISDTTRRPRANDGLLEQNGREYWFRSEADILADLKEGEFLEAALIHNQQVSGISMREIKKAQAEHRIAIDDVEIAGAETIAAAKPSTIIIFVLPPSFEEWQQRLKLRGPMSDAEHRRRLESAVKEFTAARDHDYYHLVVNDDLTTAVQEVDQLALHPPTKAVRSPEHLTLLEQLYQDTVQALNHNT